MSFLCETPEPQVQPTTQTVINEVPAYEQEARKRLYGRADAIAAEPYTPYGGQRLAPFTADEQNAFAMTRGLQGQYQPAVGAAYGMTGVASQQWPTANIGAYMNPYSRGVTDIAAREAIRNRGLQGKQLNDAFVKAGSFGGYRQGVQQAEMDRNLGTQLDDIYLKGGNAAFTQAAQLFGADRDAALKAGNQFGQLATAQQGLGLRDVAAQQAIGEAQRGQDQKSYDLAYQNFAEQRDYPKSQANWLANIIKGTSQQTGSTTQGQQLIPQASPLSQIAGLGTTALGLYGLGRGVGWFSQGGHVKGYADGGEITLEDVLRAQRAQELGIDPRLLPRRTTISAPPSAAISRIANDAEQFYRSREGLEQLREREQAYRRQVGEQSERYTPPAPRQSDPPWASSEMDAYAHGERARTTTPFDPAVDMRNPGSGNVGMPTDVTPGFGSGAPMPPPARPDASGPPDRAPGGGRAAGQTRANTGPGGSAAPAGSFYDAIRDKIFTPDKEYTPLTKPIDVNAPETKPLEEKVSPWMAITRAGLGMMAARPGQSAFQAIGEGGLGGLEQLNKDVARADSNKKINVDNAFKQADFYLKKASTENDRLVRERQLAQAEKQILLAEKGLALKFADGQLDEKYKNKSLEIQARYAAAAGGGGGQLSQLRKLVEEAYPDESPAQHAQRVLGMTKVSGTAPRGQGLTPAQALAQAENDIKNDPRSLNMTPEQRNAAKRRLARGYLEKTGGLSPDAEAELMGRFLGQ